MLRVRIPDRRDPQSQFIPLSIEYPFDMIIIWLCRQADNANPTTGPLSACRVFRRDNSFSFVM